jgi:hypothetical protein
MHKFWRRNNAIVFAKKLSFVVIPTAQNRFIGLKKLFILNTPTPKFWRRNNAIVFAKKLSFVIIPTAQNRSKFWRWRS